MTQPAAFKACYSDWKLIKTRSTVQIVLEVPVERAGLAYEVLGGMPQAGNEVWCAVARLAETKESAQQPRPSQPDSPQHTGGAHSKKNWHEMPAAQQAGLLCNESTFRRFLAEHLKYDGIAVLDLDMAAEAVRNFCGVASRRHINDDDLSGRNWRALVSDYRAWMRSPEVV